MRKGTQVCIDIMECDKTLLNDSVFLRDIITKAVDDSGFTLVEPIKMHKFFPYGVTGYALLSSSHIAIHTWPECNYASIDIYACDVKEKVFKAMQILLDALKPGKIKINSFKRGFIINTTEVNDKCQVAVKV